MHRKWLRLRTAVPSGAQHFLPLPPSSSNIVLPCQTQPYGRSSIDGVVPGIVFKSLEYAPSLYAPSLLYCCCFVVVLTLTHRHNAGRGHRTGSHNSGVEYYTSGGIIYTQVICNTTRVSRLTPPAKYSGAQDLGSDCRWALE